MNKLNPTFLMIIFSLISTSAISQSGKIKTRMETDLCVYGATGAGIFTALAAAREGYSVVIVEPFYRIGGLLGTGFRMQQDAPTGSHLGGLTGYFYKKDVSQAPLRHHQAAVRFNISTFKAMIKE